MEKRNLGRTGFAVTTLGYGAMELRHLNEPDAARVLNALLDGGVNYIDTSPDYGVSEDYIGNVIAHRRHEFYLASKCGCNIDSAGQTQEPRHIWNRPQILKNIENSLRRLKTDHLDVWQLHGPKPEELIGGKGGEIIETMIELKQQGKVRAVGISFMNGRQGDELYPDGYGFKYLREFAAWGVFDIMQIVYGGLARKSETLIAQAAEQGIGMVVRGVVKKYHDNYAALFAQAKLNELCTDNESMDGFLIQFALNHPGMSTMIIGTKNPDHLNANIAAASKGKLPDATYTEAKRRLDAIGVTPGK
ncbi:MAG: aldo/keto reductase [Chloroflexi bacterium]|nr:aldo/keto reductase [Chloroflexota bacterium]